MLAIKALVLDDQDNLGSFFGEVFEKWAVSLSIFKDVSNSLIHVNIYKPDIVLLSSDLEINYETILNYLFEKNLPVILYGETKPASKWQKFPSFQGFFSLPISVKSLKQLFVDYFGKRFIHKILSSSHLEMVINDKIAVIELGGNLIWEDALQLDLNISYEEKKGNIFGIFFIFHQIQNSVGDLINEIFPSLFNFIIREKFPVERVKYLSLDGRITNLLASVSGLPEIEKVDSYADAYLRLKSLVKGKSSKGLDIDYIRADTTLLENTYDSQGNLVKRAGEIFSKEDLRNLKQKGVLKLYYPFELSSLGVNLEKAEGIQEDIEVVIMNQVRSSMDRLADDLEKSLGDGDLKNRSVLIIEDDKHISKMLCQLFQKIKIKSEIAFNGEEGLSKAISLNPDFIILDLVMPKMNGITFLQRYRQLKKDNHSKIIILSAVNREDIIQTVFKLGASDYILKPINSHSIVKIMNHIRV